MGGSDPGANAPRVRGRDGAGACVPRPPPGAVFFGARFWSEPLGGAGGRRGREPWCVRAGRRQVLAVLWMVLLCLAALGAAGGRGRVRVRAQPRLGGCRGRCCEGEGAPPGGERRDWC